MREKQLNIRLGAEEASRLDALATHYGLSAAAVLRMLVKRDLEAVMAVALQPEDFELLRTLPEDGSQMPRPHLEKALKGDLHAKSVEWLGPSVSRLLRHQLIERDGKNFALTTKGKAVI